MTRIFGINEADFYTLVAGVCAALCLWGVNAALNRREVAVKIKSVQERRDVLRTQTLTPSRRKKPEKPVHFMRAVVMRLQLLKKNRVGQTQSLLVEADLRSRDAIYVLTFFNLVLPIVLGVAGFGAMQMLANPASKWHVFHYLWPILGAYAGLKLPVAYVARRRKKRYQQILKSLPDVLDLMTICAEAGLSLATALDRVSRELALPYPEMAEELGMTAVEMGFLPDRNKALYNLAERCGLQEVRGIVSVLVQTEKYGTPIAQALRVLSSEFRQSRMLRAEQKAARLPALMTVPMIIFVLPTLFIVIIAPAAVKLMDTLGK